MKDLVVAQVEEPPQGQKAVLGPLGYAAIACGAIGLTLLAPPGWMLPITGVSLALIWIIFPVAPQRLLRIRSLFLIGLMVVPVVLASGFSWQVGSSFSINQEGLLLGAQILLRMLVFLTAITGFTAVVDISTIAGIFERLGLKGLGFSMGVAINFLPVLQRSARQSWHSLWIRGGFRRRRWRSLRYLALTIGTHAIHRAEEIAMAAQARAYSPERSRAAPIKNGQLDAALSAVIIFSLFALATLG